MSSRQNKWFVLGEGIAREVISADIQRYLGNDALVKPGVNDKGQPGYWITAYRTLTTQMIQDLKSDSRRWQEEQDQRRARGAAYEGSRTYADRHDLAAPDPYEREAPRPSHSTPYAADPHYTTAPPAGYGHTPGYPVQTTQYAANTAAPRVVHPNPYDAYSASREAYTPQGYTTTYTPAAPYPHPTYTAAPPATPAYSVPSPVAAPGYYIASDGRQYPISQRPPQQQPPSGNSRGHHR
ncbi:hypothetical protein M011DRAFT_402897 [Sporormia fimetaria CBS 119925]|uniref:Uncharacterized protein n=1 Tax=Sporormia fimetaria CBS 119925 TaxID=1340428 RepID=A0A6A6VDN4_9PLEO|nr:hypothetical protein M011DRAFT_402897 [Sporormia fimetaria CBS 119925]